ncbi:winged helix-turn-helix transcriptional regulator [Companilactobacillus metriopterae]|uniref:winged helix-turn-helix transcriptional regulator n=1 Tax=Companilactobacillus metriopterae TaxID=1909267 RepID=UPI00100AFBCC|nr:helix-turn-helix domain-containing protein [Companilactobacillus metriopterae]
MKKKYHIGIEASLDVIAEKWKPLILCYIGVGINRNGQLLNEIPEISQKVLTEQLRQLIEDGILYKERFDEKIPQVEYKFTEYGENLKDIMLVLCKWGEGHIEYMNKLGNEFNLQDSIN